MSRILIVEDEARIASFLEKGLKANGFATRVAGDGETALGLVRAGDYDLVVLDIGLPGMDGYDVAARLRELDGLRDTVLIAITGYGQEDDRKRSRDAGFDHHLVKPVEIGILNDLLSTTFGRAA